MASSVYALVPVLEPKQRTGNPLEAGPAFGLVLGVLMLVLLTAVPPAAVASAGAVLGAAWLTWLAVPVGLATGAGLAIWGARQAERRLRAAGPELLAAMRGGTPVTVPVPGRPAASGPAPKLPRGMRALVSFFWIFCWIPLFPQGLVPLTMIFTGNENRLWFLALHVEDPWRVPVALAFTLLGLVMLTAAAILPRRVAGRS